MSFAADVKSEIMQSPSPKDCCARAELASIVFLSGSVSLRGFHRYSLTVTSENASVVRYGYQLIKRLFGLTPELRATRSTQRGEHNSYALQMDGEDALAVMKGLDMMDKQSLLGFRTSPSGRLLRKDCCKKAYLRGAFLSCGWVSRPEKSYHLEWAAPDEQEAQNIQGLLRQWELEAGISQRKSQWVVYVKKYEHLETLLGLLGASGAVMQLVNVRMMKNLRNELNRQLICDNFNTDRTVRAATLQQADIELIVRYMGLSKLSAPLRDLAEARLGNLDANLAQLGEMMDPPVGKSTVNNRMRRLSAIAQKIREEHGL